MLDHQGENSEKSGFLKALTRVRWVLPLHFGETGCWSCAGTQGAGKEPSALLANKWTVSSSLWGHLIQAGLVHVLLFPRGEIMLPVWFSVQLQRKVSHWVLKEIPRAFLILAWECPMVACALLLSHWLWWVLPLGSACVPTWFRRLVGEVGKITWRFKWEVVGEVSDGAVQLFQFHYFDVNILIYLMLVYKNEGKRCIVWTVEVREKCCAQCLVFNSLNTLCPRYQKFSPASHDLMPLVAKLSSSSQAPHLYSWQRHSMCYTWQKAICLLVAINLKMSSSCHLDFLKDKLSLSFHWWEIWILSASSFFTKLEWV